MIAGQVSDLDNDWTWRSACMTLTEARHLGKWLRDASNGSITRGSRPSRFFFMEQDLALALDERSDEWVTISWTLADDCAPRPATPAGKSRVGIQLPITISSTDLLEQAAEWDSELAGYELRGPYLSVDGDGIPRFRNDP
jgi:hypothetical protein